MALATQTVPEHSHNSKLQQLLDQHLNWLQIKGYSDYTVRSRFVHIRFFLRWCAKRRVTAPDQITTDVLRDYQQHAFEYRKRNGEPLSLTSRHARLVPLRVWFRWMAQHQLVSTDLVNAIELPRLGRPLPRSILSTQEVERVLSQPDVRTPIGLRDRAILEVLYSTGIRRLELVHLNVSDCQFDRRLLFVREGKGMKDRYVPLGARAANWLREYLRDARPIFACASETDSVFVSRYGRSLSRDHLTYIARRYVAAARLGKGGACHLFRHTMATLMHENGADIRHIQQMLGHADIKTTQIYTQVAIRTLQRVHAATHPAAA